MTRVEYAITSASALVLWRDAQFRQLMTFISVCMDYIQYGASSGMQNVCYNLLGIIMGMQVVGWNVHEPMHDFITKKPCICIYDALYVCTCTATYVCTWLRLQRIDQRHLHKSGLECGPFKMGG